MSQVELCFKGPSDKRPHSLSTIDAVHLARLAHTLRPYVVPMFSNSHLRDLIPTLHNFADDSAANEKFIIEFKLREVLELFAVCNESTLNVNRKLSFELRTMLGEGGMLADDICSSMESNQDFNQLRIHNQLLRVLSKIIRERASLILRRAQHT